MKSSDDHLPDEPAGDRAVIALLLLAAGAFALMFIWLVAR